MADMREPKMIAGRYRITGPLGEGGMATVFSGIDEITNRDIAIKLLKSDLNQPSPMMIERFEREGEALRRLNHPNIVKMLASVKDGGRQYVIMERVSGGDLRSLLRQEKRLSIERTLDITIDLCDALIRAHRLKIVHRDIKPENVLLAEDGTPRLTDFGVAHFGDATRVTQTGSLIGTLAYLSPEGCIGEDLDHRTDIWSLGVMLYEMLSGYRPFMETGSAALLGAILSQPIPPLEKLRPETPQALVRLVNRMLEKDRDKRISSMRQVSTVVEAVMQGKELTEGAFDALTNTPLDSTDAIDDEDGRQSTPLEALQGAISEYRTSRSQLPEDSLPMPEDIHTITPAPPPSSSASGVSASGTASQQRDLPHSLLIGGVIAVVAMVGLLIVLLSSSGEVEPQTVTPVADGEFMVLVAPPELIGGADDDVTRFVIDDLTRKFEQDTSFSTFRVRQYPNAITSTEQAREVATLNGAHVVIWGDYDGEVARLNVQIGDLSAWGETAFTEAELRAIADVRVLLRAPRDESLVAPVLAASNIMQTAIDNQFGVGLNLAILQQTNPMTPEIDGSGIGAAWHRYFADFFNDAVALDLIDDALLLEPDHPILNLARSLSLQQVGRYIESEQTFDIARQFGPEGWLLPDKSEAQYWLMLDNDPARALDILDTILATDDDDWLMLFFRGAAHYLTGDYAAAGDDLQQSLDLNPPVNFPYFFIFAEALRNGDVIRSQQAINSIRSEDNLRDINASERILSASYGITANDSTLVATVRGVGQMALLDWRGAIESAQLAIDLGQYPTFVEPYLLQGFAYCNLEEYENAEAAYTQAIEIDPDYVVAYALRAEVRLRQQDIIGATQDQQVVANSPDSAVYTPLVAGYISGDLSCENLYDIDLTQFYED